jgi:hypothetical protein
MFRRIGITLVTLLVGGAAFAQTTTADLEARVKEMQRQIDVLTQEIEAIKTGEAAKKPVRADTTQYGLGAAASKVYRADQGVSFGGYGEFETLTASAPGRDAHTFTEYSRAVLYTGYKFSDRVLFNSELEVEGGSTERGGSVGMEFGYLDFMLNPKANIRAGVVLVPMGLTNEQHEPTAYLGTEKPYTEQLIIPGTWSETGAGMFGDAGRFSYRAFAVTPLGDDINQYQGLHEAPRKGSVSIGRHPALVGRLDFHPTLGTTIGASHYHGSVESPYYKDQAKVRLTEVHVESKFRGATFRALVASGSAGQQLVDNFQLGPYFAGWYAEAGYDLMSPLRGTHTFSVTPYVRYEAFNTLRQTRRIFSNDDRKFFTAGFEVKPIPQTVFKIDWQNQDNQFVKSHQVAATLGYIF